MPTLVPKYKVFTLYSGTGTVPEFWRGYLKKRCVHISAQRESYSGTKCEHGLSVKFDPDTTNLGVICFLDKFLNLKDKQESKTPKAVQYGLVNNKCVQLLS